MMKSMGLEHKLLKGLSEKDKSKKMFSEAKLKKFLNTMQKRLDFFSVECSVTVSIHRWVFFLSTYPLIPPPTHPLWSN